MTKVLPEVEACARELRATKRNTGHTLRTRNNIAAWTGETDAREALRLSRELLSDQARVLGADHPETLATRNQIAYWTRQTGDASAALRLFRELLPDQARPRP